MTSQSTETTPLLGDAPSRTSPSLNASESTALASSTADGPAIEAAIPDASSNGQAEDNGQMYTGLPHLRAKMPLIFPAIAIGVLLAAADSTIVVSSYAKIGSDLDALNKTSWIANAYFLTLTAFQPMYGKLSDIFGRKACLLFAYAVFGTGCLFCGLARNIDELIWARAFSGLGGSGMTTVVSILLSDIIPLRERGTWQGYINLAYASGAGLGAPAGGIIADNISWRWAFLSQVPLCLIAFIAVSVLLTDLTPPTKPSTSTSSATEPKPPSWRSKILRIDFIGAITLLAAVFALILSLDMGSNQLSWTSPLTLGTFGASILLFILFFLIERFIAIEPFVPGRLIFSSNFIAAYLCNFFSFLGWLATIFFMPLYYQAVHKLSATSASLLLVPSVICGVSGSLFAGWFMQRTGTYYTLTICCYSSLVLGLVLITLFSGLDTAPQPYQIPAMVTGMSICAFSNGIGVTSTLIGLLANAESNEQAVATACSYLFRSLGTVLGMATSATAVNQTLRTLLREKLDDLGKDPAEAEKIADMVRKSLESIAELPPDVASVVRACYARSTTVAFGLEVFLVMGAAISAWFIKIKPLSK